MNGKVHDYSVFLECLSCKSSASFPCKNCGTSLASLAKENQRQRLFEDQRKRSSQNAIIIVISLVFGAGILFWMTL